jgi:hypothetical protein
MVAGWLAFPARYGGKIAIANPPESAHAHEMNYKSPIVYSWNFIFDHEVSPLRNIPDIALRHYVLQGLGLMWAVCFSLAIGSYTFLAASIIGHTLLIGAAAITVAVLSTAAAKPNLFARISGRRHDGEHD